MAPTQSTMMATRRSSTHRVIKRERSSSSHSVPHAMPHLETRLEAAISIHAHDNRANFGHAIGVVLGSESMFYTRAIFDYKALGSGDATHWGEDDIGDEYLRDFTLIQHLPTDSATPSIELDAEDHAEPVMFMGHLFFTDDPNPRPITATLVRNKQGRWIGENVLDITHDLVMKMTEELPLHIAGQIYKWRELEAERDKREREDWEETTWDAQMERREEAVRKREEALQKREGELRELEMRLRENMG